MRHQVFDTNRTAGKELDIWRTRFGDTCNKEQSANPTCGLCRCPATKLGFLWIFEIVFFCALRVSGADLAFKSILEGLFTDIYRYLMITLSANPKGLTLPGLQCTTSFLGKYIEILPKSMIPSHVKVRFQTILVTKPAASPFRNPCFLALEKSKDTTLAALATHLGLELPTIGFGAFLAFELHQVPDANATNHAESGQSHSSDESSQFVVKTYYNSNPTEGASSYALKCLALPLHEERW